MAIIIPEEFKPLTLGPKYKKKPVSRATLLRAMENIDRAKTQEDQDTIARQIEQSTRRAISPELIRSLEERYGNQGLRLEREPEPTPKRIQVPEPTRREVEEARPMPDVGYKPVVALERPPLSKIATAKRLGAPVVGEAEPPQIEGESVFATPEDHTRAMEEADAAAIPYEKRVPGVKKALGLEVLGEVPESYWEKRKAAEAPIKQRSEFEQAFAAARAKGLKEFPWKGEMKSTLYEGETPYEKRLAAIEKEPTVEPSRYEAAIQEKGATIKKGVSTRGVRNEMVEGISTILDVYRKIGVKAPEITSGKRDPIRGSRRSFHLIGLGTDLDILSLSKNQRRALKSEFDKLSETNPPRQKTKAGWDRWKFGSNEVIIHDTGRGLHVHVEYDNPDTQAQLDVFMEMLKTKAPQEELDKLMGLFNTGVTKAQLQEHYPLIMKKLRKK